MPRLLVALGIVATLLTSASGADQPAAATADPPPAFQGLRLDGSPFDSGDLLGGFVLLDFWGVWCPPCIGAFPKLSRLHDDFSNRGFQVVGLAVLSGTPEEVAEFLEEFDVTYLVVVVERDVPRLFNVLAYPSYFLLGPAGEIVKAYQGQPNDLYELVAADLEALLPAPAP